MVKCLAFKYCWQLTEWCKITHMLLVYPNFDCNFGPVEHQGEPCVATNTYARASMG